MSSLGYQRILALLRESGVAAERVFLPDDPEEYRRTSTRVFSAETHTGLGQFPIIAISLAYELEIAGLVELLELAGIPPLREQRTAAHPVILIGGPITMASPLAAAPFADAFLLGEGEDVAARAVNAWFDAESRESWLDAVAALPGGWIPERTLALPILAKASDEHLPARSAILAPDAELSSMFLLEGERGCHRQCTFCVMRRSTNGGMRLVGAERVLSLVPTEARRVGLVGAAISDHPSLVEILGVLVGDGRQVSVSSLRADRVMVRPRIAELLRQSGARTLTVASDGASARLRREISKGTTEAHLLACGEIAGRVGFETLKIYMMLGLPGETDDDVDELIRFSLDLARASRPARVALGVAPLVPKRNTPLDGVPFAGIDVVDDRMARLTRGLRGKVEVRPVSARWAWVEYVLAQGGPAEGRAVLDAFRAGGRFAHYKAAFGRNWAPARDALALGA
jgi:radical SAM superfamily enzyme YgiQ (UPF0313 family)